MTTPARPTQARGRADHNTVVALADALLNAVLGARIHIGFRQPDDVREAQRLLMAGFYSLGALYDALAPDLPAASADGPRQIAHPKEHTP